MRTHFIYIMIIIIALLASLFWSVSNSRNIEENYIVNVNDTINYYKNKLGLIVAEKKAVQGKQRDLVKLIKSKEKENNQLIATIDKFKEIHSVTKIKTETKIDTVKLLFKDTIYINNLKNFDYKTKYYEISGIVSNDFVAINTFKIPNEQNIVIGKKKLNFLKTEYRAEVTNSNPLITVKDMSAYSFSVPQKRLGIGLTAGYGIGQNYNGFFLGIGINYNIILF